MVLPTAPSSTLLLSVLSMIALASWLGTYKLAGKWRYEFYYYDYAFGVVLAAVIAAFTFGSMESSELSFQDNFLIAARRPMASALGAGVLFNFANVLLVAASAVSG